MTVVQTPSRRPARIAPLLLCAGLVAVVIGAQVSGLMPGSQPAAALDANVDDPMLVAPAAEPVDGSTVGAQAEAGDGEDGDGLAIGDAAGDGFDAAAELARVRADVDFWGGRLQAHPAGIVAPPEPPGAGRPGPRG